MQLMDERLEIDRALGLIPASADAETQIRLALDRFGRVLLNLAEAEGLGRDAIDWLNRSIEEAGARVGLR